jgi:branched-chain amino acid transport system substrate-binding protein
LNRVYASLPLRGPAAQAGREVLRGAELALERTESSVGLISLDSFGEDREHQAIANARRAAEDGEAMAYLGDFHSSQVLETAPILGEAGLLQIAPVATFIGLGGSTLVRLSPHDGVGARAIAAWLVEADIENLLVVHDHDGGYGIPVGAMCVEAARGRGLAVRSRPVWDEGDSPAEDLGDADAVLYVGVCGSGTGALWRDLHEARPAMWLLGSEGVAEPWLAEEISPSAAMRTRFFIAYRAPLAFYGYEAMALALDTIAAGEGDRPAIVNAARSTKDRESIIGRYSLDEQGHTTNTAYGRLAVVDGRLVWDLQDPN